MAPKNKNKKPKLNCGRLLKILLVLNLSSCATTHPPDVPLCVEFAPDRGRCVKIISGEIFDVDEKNKFEDKTWWEHRPAMIQMPASSWVQIKSYLIKTCKKYNICEKEISSWDRTVETIDDNLNKKEGTINELLSND